MTYVKTYLTLKTHVVNLKRDAKDLSRDSQRLEVRGKLGSKTLYCSTENYAESVEKSNEELRSHLGIELRTSRTECRALTNCANPPILSQYSPT